MTLFQRLSVALAGVPHSVVIAAPAIVVVCLQLLKDLPGTPLAWTIPYVQFVFVVAGFIANNAHQMAAGQKADAVDDAIAKKSLPPPAPKG